MFAVLDTNHYVALVAGGLQASLINLRATESDADLFTTIIAPQEILQGWLAAINREAAGRDQVFGYARFHHSLLGLSKMTALPFDTDSAEAFHRLKSTHPRAGTMDLKIAAICLAHDATLLTRNVRDFEGIAGLRVENWLD